eukprot:5515500-Amphidinium_carterae.1
MIFAQVLVIASEFISTGIAACCNIAMFTCASAFCTLRCGRCTWSFQLGCASHSRSKAHLTDSSGQGSAVQETYAPNNLKTKGTPRNHPTKWDEVNRKDIANTSGAKKICA